MDPILTSTNTPSYKEIIIQVGKQLALRKRDIFKRISLLSWPFVILAGFVYLTRANGSFDLFYHREPKLFLIISIVIIAVLVPYYFLISFIVNIEKHLWIDSSFDKRSIDSKTSWRLAWKLLFPVLGLTFQIMFRYYFPVIFVAILGFMGLAFLSFNTNIVSLLPDIMWVPAICVLLVLIVAIYFYLLRVKLRFIFFLFIDRFNKDSFTYSTLFNEMNQLNAVCKTENFKKALVINFGSDVLQNIVLVVLDAIQTGLKSVGQFSGFIGTVAKPFAEESVRQIKSYARLSAIYLLYIQARSMLYNQPQEENKYIYSL